MAGSFDTDDPEGDGDGDGDGCADDTPCNKRATTDSTIAYVPASAPTRTEEALVIDMPRSLHPLPSEEA
jgi:hypothetical protein